MRTALLFGASGQIGAPLSDLLRDSGWRVLAVSRIAHDETPGLSWLPGDLAAPQTLASLLPRQAQAIFSCGPLDHFARWYAQSALRCPRVIAFGSTSIDAKRGSADAEERALAARLREAEALLADAAAARDAALTVLRPTLIYGSGVDRNLSRLVAIARRFGRLALPRGAHGLRQPVHARDLAQAAFACLEAEASFGRTYALPGGETLSYRDMVLRTLATLTPPPALHEVPAPLFHALLAFAHAAGLARDVNEAVVARMRSDLVFDPLPAQRDFGYAPRGFAPHACMFETDRHARAPVETEGATRA